MELEHKQASTVRDTKTEWFCVRSKPKAEHIAAKHLEEAAFEVFLPRIRFQRLTRRGRVWFTEALFPGYLFSRFDRGLSFRQVCATNGVTTVVIAPGLEPGDEVTIAAGPFQGLLAVVNQVMPAPQRVRVLLEFLGRQTSVEVSSETVIPVGEPRALALQPPPAEDEEE
jgi:transcriptional antiterminator RfaH